MFEEYINEYIFSGSLPENASTYVKREADDELYEALTAGKFCYVLNSRQSGKSSLRVRTMSRLTDVGVECASIDLSSISIQSATQENWYADLIVKLIDSFDLDIDFQSWWEKNQINSSLWRFGNFLEKILLAEIPEKIVIFIDEIDSVLSLNFPTDDFFAFIRSCYNQRVDNPNYNRLSFCLLGVASPSNLIEDKKRTPFNIGKAIALKGFQLHEVEPLKRGLQSRYPDFHGVMKDILHWTRGQPFLTQKLCQFMVEESLKDNARTVEQVVRERIIENWESQDEPEHFRTIRDRILRDEQRAGYLLELYQQIRYLEEKAEITADDTLEQSELQLSGLVVRQQNKLRVYNPIYREIFDRDWIETQLRNLRPYSENFRFWIASGGKDTSRLLRGKALQDALEWADDKSLNYQDREFLAASQTKEKEEAIAALEREAQLERERKNREAAEKRNQLLAEANKKAQQRIHTGTIAFIFTLSLTVFSGITAAYFKNQIDQYQEYLKTAKELVNTNAKLKRVKQGKNNETGEISSQADGAVKISDDNLKLALINLGLAVVYQKLREENYWTKVLYFLKAAEVYISKSKTKDSFREKLQIIILSFQVRGSLFEEKDKDYAIEFYKKAYDILQSHKNHLFDDNYNILSKESVEALYKKLILLSDSSNNTNLKSQVEKSLKEYYYNEMYNLLATGKLPEADEITTKLMLYIAGVEEDKLDKTSINKFQSFCSDLQKIDELWVKHATYDFGFSEQRQWWGTSQPKKHFRDSEIVAVVKKGGQAEGYAIPKEGIFSTFLPPAIAGTPPEYPSIGFKNRDILYVCPFNMDLIYDAVVFAPPSNVRIFPNGGVKCQINSQQRIRVNADPKGGWYYTTACSGGWIHESQIQVKKRV